MKIQPKCNVCGRISDTNLDNQDMCNICALGVQLLELKQKHATQLKELYELENRITAIERELPNIRTMCSCNREHLQSMNKETKLPEREPFTTEQQQIIDKINKMSHFEMCSLWRFSPSGHIYFDSALPYIDVFKTRLFDHFGGFTPEISKAISR